MTGYYSTSWTSGGLQTNQSAFEFSWINVAKNKNSKGGKKKKKKKKEARSLRCSFYFCRAAQESAGRRSLSIRTTGPTRMFILKTLTEPRTCKRIVYLRALTARRQRLQKWLIREINVLVLFQDWAPESTHSFRKKKKKKPLRWANCAP